jgi:hypothetical protein
MKGLSRSAGSLASCRERYYVYLAEDSGDENNTVGETDDQDEAMNLEDNKFLHPTANDWAV